MLPVLLDLGFIKIYTFGVFLMLSFFWGSFLLWKNIRLTAFSEEDIFDGLFLSLAGGLFFGRLFYVLLNFKDFGFSFLKFILINGYPGLNFYGALFGSIIVLYVFFRQKKIKFSQVIDYFMGPLFVALGFSFLGSFFSQSPLQINFFYQGLFFFLAYYPAQNILFSIRKELYPSGFLFVFSLWYISAIYFLFDKWEINWLYLKELNFNNLTSILIFFLTTFYLIYYFRSKIINYGKSAYQKIYRGAEKTFKTRFGKGKKSN